MVREIAGAGGGQYNPQIKRVSVRSNAAGHANAGVIVPGAAPPKAALTIKDTVSIKSAPAAVKPQR